MFSRGTSSTSMVAPLESQLAELDRIGFVESSPRLNRYFLETPEFRLTHGRFRSNSRFFPGISYYFRLSRSDIIERHLEAAFRTKNPADQTKLLRTFGRIMHENYLHWSGCRHKRPIGSKGVPRGTMRPQRLVTQDDLQRLRKLIDSP
jgi:hypothetical protein